MKRENNKSTLPREYKQLEYIESTGTQYIETNLSAPDGFSVKLNWIWKDNVSIQSYIIGSHNLSSPYGRNGVQKGNTLQWGLGLGNYYPRGGSFLLNTQYSIDASTIKGNSYLKVDDETVLLSLDSSTRSLNNILIFASQYRLDENPKTKGILNGYIEISINDNTYTLCPALRNVDRKTGVFNITTQIFYPNLGDEEFLYQ